MGIGGPLKKASAYAHIWKTKPRDPCIPDQQIVSRPISSSALIDCHFVCCSSSVCLKPLSLVAMSWDSYIDNLIAQSKDAGGTVHVDKACIIGIDGGAKWTTDGHANAYKVGMVVSKDSACNAPSLGMIDVVMTSAQALDALARGTPLSLF